MKSLFYKRGIWIGFCLLIAFLAMGLFASFIAGQRLANTLLNQELENITGRRVTLQTQPVISIYPSLTAEFSDVSFHNWGYASDNFPVLEAPMMRLTFSIFAALSGETQVTSVFLEQPVLRAKAEDGTWQLLFSNQSELAKQFASLVAALPAAPKPDVLANLLDRAPGPITINNGTILIDGEAKQTISGVDAKLVWLTGEREGHLKASGLWRGEPTTIEIYTDDVVQLASGADAALKVSLTSKPITASFSGQTRLSPAPYFEGRVFAKADSLMAAARWQGVSAPFDFAAFGLTLAGDLKGDAEKLQLEESQLQLGTNKGTGGLTYQPNMSPPALSGTLDFESLDLGLLSQIFELRPTTEKAAPPDYSTDLRISAAMASFGVFSLREVAASLLVSKQANILDIHNAAAFGGTLQMSLKRQNNAATELRILAENVETQALAKLSPVFAALPQTTGSISAILQGSNIADPEFFETAKGTLKLRFNEGAVDGYNANQLVRELRKGGFFAVKPQAPSILSFTRIDAEATLAQGTLQFDPLRVGFDRAALELFGAYAIKGESIALTGTLDLDDDHPEATNGAETLKVFFGGTREAPLMSGLP